MTAGDNLENTVSSQKSTSTNPYLLWKSDVVKQRLLRLKNARFPTQRPKPQASRDRQSDTLGAKKEAVPTLHRGKTDEKCRGRGEFPRLQGHFSTEAAKNSISSHRGDHIHRTGPDSAGTYSGGLRRPYQGLDKTSSSSTEKVAPRWLESEKEQWKQLQAIFRDTHNGSITTSSSDDSEESSIENDSENSADSSESVSHDSMSDDSCIITDKNGNNEDVEENAPADHAYPALMEMRALTQSVAMNAGLEHMECYTVPDSECESGPNTPHRGFSQGSSEGPDTLKVQVNLRGDNAGGGSESTSSRPLPYASADQFNNAKCGRQGTKSPFEERGTFSGVCPKNSDSDPGENVFDDERHSIYAGLNVVRSRKSTTDINNCIIDEVERACQSPNEEKARTMEWKDTERRWKTKTEHTEQTRGMEDKHEDCPMRCKRMMIMNMEKSEKDIKEAYKSNREVPWTHGCIRKVLKDKGEKKRSEANCQDEEEMNGMIKNAYSALHEVSPNSRGSHLDPESSEARRNPNLIQSSKSKDNCYHGYANDALSIATARHKDESPERQTLIGSENENIDENNAGMMITQIYKEAVQKRTFKDTENESTSTGWSNQASPECEGARSTGHGDLNAEQELASRDPGNYTLPLISQRVNNSCGNNFTDLKRIQQDNGQLLHRKAGASDISGDSNGKGTQGNNGTGYNDTSELRSGDKDKKFVSSASFAVEDKPTRSSCTDYTSSNYAKGMGTNEARGSGSFNGQKNSKALEVSIADNTQGKESKELDDCPTTNPKSDYFCPLQRKYDTLTVNSDEPNETFDLRDLYREAKLVHFSPLADVKDVSNTIASEPLEEYDLGKLYKAASRVAITSILGDSPLESGQRIQRKLSPTLSDESVDSGSMGQLSSLKLKDDAALPDENVTRTEKRGLTLTGEPQERRNGSKERLKNPGCIVPSEITVLSGNVMEVEEIQDKPLPQPIQKVDVYCKERNVAPRDSSVAAWRSPTAAPSPECQHEKSGAVKTLRETGHMIKSSLSSEKNEHNAASSEGSCLSSSTSPRGVANIQRGISENCSSYDELKTKTRVENNTFGTAAGYVMDYVNLTSARIEKETDSPLCPEKACSPIVSNERTPDHISANDKEQECALFQNSENIHTVDETCVMTGKAKMHTRHYDFDSKNGTIHENMDSQTQFNHHQTGDQTRDVLQSLNNLPVLNPIGPDTAPSLEEFDASSIHQLPSPECPCTSLVSETSHKMLGTTGDQLPQLKHSSCVQRAPSVGSSDVTFAPTSSPGLASRGSLQAADATAVTTESDRCAKSVNDSDSSTSISSAGISDNDLTRMDNTQEFNIAARKKKFEKFLTARFVGKLSANQTRVDPVPQKVQPANEVVRGKTSPFKSKNDASRTKRPFACLIMGSKINVSKKPVTQNRSFNREISAEVNRISRTKNTNIKNRESMRLNIKDNGPLQSEWNSGNKKALVFHERKTGLAKTATPKKVEAPRATKTNQHTKQTVFQVAKVRDNGRGDALGKITKQTVSIGKMANKGKGDIPLTKCDKTVLKNNGEKIQQVRERVSISLPHPTKEKKCSSCTVLQSKHKNSDILRAKESVEAKTSFPDLNLAKTCMTKQGMINTENKKPNDKMFTHIRSSDLESPTHQGENSSVKKNDVQAKCKSTKRMTNSPVPETPRQQSKTTQNNFPEKDIPTLQRHKLLGSVLKSTKNFARKGLVKHEKKRLPKLKSPAPGSNGNNSSCVGYKGLVAAAKARAISRISKTLWGASPRSHCLSPTSQARSTGGDSPTYEPEVIRSTTDSPDFVETEDVSCMGATLQLPSITCACSSEAQKEDACYRATQLSGTCLEQATTERPGSGLKKSERLKMLKPPTRFPEIRTATSSSSKRTGIGKQILLSSNETETAFTKFPLLSVSEKEEGLYAIRDDNTPKGDENRNNSTTRSGSSSPDDNMGSVDLPSHPKELFSVYPHNEVQMPMGEAKEFSVLSVSDPFQGSRNSSHEIQRKKSRIPIRKPQPKKKITCNGENRFLDTGKGSVDEQAVMSNTGKKIPLEKMQTNAVSSRRVQTRSNIRALQKACEVKTVTCHRERSIQQDNNPQPRENTNFSPTMRTPLPERLKKYYRPKIPAHTAHRMMRRNALHKKLTTNDELVSSTATVTPCSSSPGATNTSQSKTKSGKSMVTVPFVKLGPCKEKLPRANEERFTSCIRNSLHPNATGLNKACPDKEHGKHVDSKLKSTYNKRWTSYYTCARASPRIHSGCPYRRASSQASYKHQTPRSPESTSCLVHVRTPVGFVKYVHRPALNRQERSGIRPSNQEQRHLLSRCELFSTSSKSSLGKESAMSDIESLQTQDAKCQKDGHSHELDLKKESTQNDREEKKARVSAHDAGLGEKKGDTSLAESIPAQKVKYSISNSSRSEVADKGSCQSTKSITVNNVSKTLLECRNLETAASITSTFKALGQNAAVHVSKITNEVRSKISSDILESGSNTESDLNGTFTSTSFAVYSKGTGQGFHDGADDSMNSIVQVNGRAQKDGLKAFSKLTNDNGAMMAKTQADFGPIPCSTSPRVNLRPERPKESVGEKLTLTSADSLVSTGSQNVIRGTKQNRHHIFKSPRGTLCFATNTTVLPGVPPSAYKIETLGTDNCSLQQNTAFAMAENQRVHRYNLDAKRNGVIEDVKNANCDDVDHDRLSAKDSRSNEVSSKVSLLYEFRSPAKPGSHECSSMKTETDPSLTPLTRSKRTRFRDGVQDSEFGESESTSSLGRAEYSRTRYRPLDALITHDDFVEYAQETGAVSDDDTLISTAAPQQQHAANRPKRGRLTVASSSVQPRWSAEALAASQDSLVSYEYEPEEEECVENERGGDTTSDFDDIQDESCNHVKSEAGTCTSNSAPEGKGKKKSLNVAEEDSCPLPPLSKRQVGRPHRLNVKRHY